MLDRCLNWVRRRPDRRAAGLVAAIGLGAMLAATEPPVWAAHAAVLRATLLACAGFFAARLGLRVWRARGLPPTDRYADLLSALAAPVGFALGGQEPMVWLVAVAWATQLAPAPQGLRILLRVVALEARPLAAAGTLFVAVLFGSAIAAYLLEHAAQPQTFGSMPAALWWAVTTLTTTGYGDAVPQSSAGRLLAACVMIAGLSVFGLFTGILATGFAAESRRQDFLHSWELVAQVPFFQSLNAAGVAEMAAALRRLDLAENTVVVRRGRLGDCMYFIVAGEVEVDLDPAPVRLGAGCFFGEMALLGSGVRNATISTLRPTTLLVLDIADFRRLAARHPELASAVEREALHRGGDPIGYTASVRMETKP